MSVHYTLKGKKLGNLFVYDGNGLVEDRKKVIVAAEVLTPVSLDASNAGEVDVAASGATAASVWAVLLQKVLDADPSLAIYPQTLADSSAFKNDEVTMAWGTARCEIGKDLYVGVIAINNLLGWNGTKYAITTDATKAILKAETAGTGGTNRIVVKVLL